MNQRVNIWNYPSSSGLKENRPSRSNPFLRNWGTSLTIPGFTATAACTSKITFIDGGKGILRYRGYPIEQLAERSTFVEVAYLLLNGELPTELELDQFRDELTYHTMVHEQLNHFISGFHYDAHPMAMMAGVVGSLAAFYHNRLDMDEPGTPRVVGQAHDCQNADHRRRLLPASHGLASGLTRKTHSGFASVS